jgi:hypothetical protein
MSRTDSRTGFRAYRLFRLPMRVLKIGQRAMESTMSRYLILGLSLAVTTALVSPAVAAEKSVTGKLEDSFCYVTMGAHGPNHQKCAQTCAKKGIPVSLVEKGSGDMYVLLPPKNDEPISDNITNKMEDQVTVTGDEYVKGGVHYLTVKSVK